jgi:hypothetical protein
MPLEADAAGWWDDPELVAVKQRIERRRAREVSVAAAARQHGGTARQHDSAKPKPKPKPKRRGVREVRGVARLALVAPGGVAGSDPQGAQSAPRRRPRPRPLERLGPRPDMIAAWAVVLGIVLLVVAILTSHG